MHSVGVLHAIADERIMGENGGAMLNTARLIAFAATIWRAPSGARVAWFKDPDGNTLSLTQM